MNKNKVQSRIISGGIPLENLQFKTNSPCDVIGCTSDKASSNSLGKKLCSAHYDIISGRRTCDCGNSFYIPKTACDKCTRFTKKQREGHANRIRDFDEKIKKAKDSLSHIEWRKCEFEKSLEPESDHERYEYTD